jgi:hypothetical protein
MKKIYLAIVATVFCALSGVAQTVYSENMGSPAATTLITAYSGWQNTAPITYTGTGDVRTSVPSTGYTGASGSGNVFLTSTAGRNLIISGINTSAYLSADLQLSFGYLVSNTSTQLTLEKSTDGGTNWSPITFTNNANTSWNLVTIGAGQIPSTTNLSLRFTQPGTVQMRIDDVKIVNISSTCSLAPGAPLTACDATTLGIDTYTISIPFTGGGTATYVITPTSGVVLGDNPNSVASGNIIIAGTNEGVDNTITITGGTCNYTIPVLAPTGGCKPVNTLPFDEPFNYTVGNSLTAEQKWTSVNTGDNIVIAAGSLSYPGVTTTGNSATFGGAGIEARTLFTSATSGTIYSSFLFSVPAAGYDNVTVDLTNTYFALLTDNTGGSTNARVWIRKNGAQYQFGLGSTAAPDTWSPNLYDVGTTQYLIFGYDFATNSFALYENQGTPLTPTISVIAAAPLVNVGGFMLRQDAANTTPTIVVDELKINTALPTLSNDSFNDIVGLRVYPNPAKNTLFVTSDSFAVKNVAIYDVLGKATLTAKVTNAPLNISSLTSGIYIVKITEGNKTATRKLVIE